MQQNRTTAAYMRVTVHTHHHGAGAEEHGALEPDPQAASAPHDGVLPYIPDSVRNRPRK